MFKVLSTVYANYAYLYNPIVSILEYVIFASTEQFIAYHY
jgi:hypothetical protein